MPRNNIMRRLANLEPEIERITVSLTLLNRDAYTRRSKLLKRLLIILHILKNKLNLCCADFKREVFPEIQVECKTLLRLGFIEAIEV